MAGRAYTSSRAATMIGVFSLLLPIALAAYCIYRAVKCPLFLLGIPFLQVARESIFLSPIKVFWLPGELGGTNGAVLLWIALAWAWCAYRSTTRKDLTRISSGRQSTRPLLEEYLLVAVAVLVLVKLLWSSLGSGGTNTLLSQFAPWALLLVGFWLVRGVVRRSSSRDVVAFLLFVAVATCIGSALFILHQGLRIPIYQATEYSVFTYEGETLSRTFWFMSPFLLVPLAVGFARRSWSVGAVALVVVTVVAVIVSYTRTDLLATVAVIAVLLAIRALKERRPDVLARRLTKVGAVVALVAVVLVLALPTPARYFLNRMESLTSTSTAVEDPNLLVRYSDMTMVTSDLWERGLLVVGAPFGVADDMSENVRYWTADSTWSGTLYWTGLIGAAVVVGMFLLFGLRAFRLFWRGSGTTEYLGAVYLALVVAMFITSLTNYTFLRPATIAMGFWLFAFISGEAAKDDNEGRAQ